MHQGKRSMEVSGLRCSLHSPAAVKSRYDGAGTELVSGLPPYALRNGFNVADFDAACPSDWRRGDLGAASYFVAVENGNGLWLDFNENSSNTHDVAALISIQGINPLTGDQVTFETLRMEQYRSTCPRHGTPLGSENFCTPCGYKVPPQNYLAGEASRGRFWLDGFRTADGTVRQFALTTEKGRGVADQLIGNAKTYAISVAFYLSKEPKPVPQYRTRGGLYPMGASDGVLESLGGTRMRSLSATRGGATSARMDIAAGAKITQMVCKDPNGLDYWQASPAGVLFINYTDVETARAILDATPVRKTKENGAFDGLVVGTHGDPFGA